MPTLGPGLAIRDFPCLHHGIILHQEPNSRFTAPLRNCVGGRPREHFCPCLMQLADVGADLHLVRSFAIRSQRRVSSCPPRSTLCDVSETTVPSDGAIDIGCGPGLAVCCWILARSSLTCARPRHRASITASALQRQAVGIF